MLKRPEDTYIGWFVSDILSIGRFGQSCHANFNCEDRARRAAGSPSGPIRHHHDLNIDTNPYPQPIFQQRPISLNSPIDQHPPRSSSIPYAHPFNLGASGSGSDNSLPPTRPPSVVSSVGPSESASAWVQNRLDVPYSSRSRQRSISRQ